jgi:hypothetical protein
MDTDSWPTKKRKKERKKEKKQPFTSESNNASTSFEVLREEFWRIPFFCNTMEICVNNQFPLFERNAVLSPSGIQNSKKIARQDQ